MNNVAPTGIAGLDTILGGGLPANRLYLVQGEPGSGKTTLGLQFLMEGAARGEAGLYITFSETKEELEQVAKSHNWNLKNVTLFELSALEQQLGLESQNTVFHPSEVEMTQTAELLLKEVDRVKPSRVVFDSVSEMRLLADTAFRYRRQMLSLKQFFAGKQSTCLFLDDLTATPADLHVQSIVHGVINLERLHSTYGDERRRLSIVKLRGVEYIGGNHDYMIRKGGVVVFPRMISSHYSGNFTHSRLESQVPELDQLLGGGLDRGTSSLFLGPAGSGKSTLAVHYAWQAAKRGEKAVIFAFEESVETLLSRTTALGMDLQPYLASGILEVHKIDPAQLSPGEFAERIRKLVEETDLRVLIIDSLNGYIHAMPEEDFLTIQLHELLAFLGNHGVSSILVLAQQGLIGNMNTPVDLTYLADTVVLFRYFEAMGSVRKAIAVIKKRGGDHESTIREFKVCRKGIQLGQPLTEFRGVLTGVPQFGDSVSVASRHEQHSLTSS